MDRPAHVNHYPHHIGDFAKDTLGFSQGAIGAYRLLLDAYYANEQAPSIDDVYVIGRATTPAERRHVDKALEKFVLRDGRYYHKRVEEELAAYYGRAESARENGKKGGRPKKPTDNRIGNPNETGQITGNETKEQTQTEPTEKLASSHKPLPPSLRSGGGRATRLSADWVLPEEWKTWALTEQPTWTELHVAKVSLNFRDHWIAAPKGTKLDWLATWRRWVRTEGPMPKSEQPRGIDAIEGAMRITAEREAGAAH